MHFTIFEACQVYDVMFQFSTLQLMENILHESN